jgi:hypothetical protein
VRPDGWATDGTIDTRVTVGCDGVVDTVESSTVAVFRLLVRCVKETTPRAVPRARPA